MVDRPSRESSAHCSQLTVHCGALSIDQWTAHSAQCRSGAPKLLSKPTALWTVTVFSTAASIVPSPITRITLVGRRVTLISSTHTRVSIALCQLIVLDGRHSTNY